MALFHERHRHLLFLSMFGGVYLPSLSRIIPWKPVNTFLKGYANTFTFGYLLLAVFALKHAIFQAENLISQVTSVNNVSDDFLAFGRMFLFNWNRKQTQALYDLWDEYFTNDGHGETRQKLIEKLKKPYKKIYIICGIFSTFMVCSWSIDQFDNETCDFSIPMGIPFHNKNPEYLIWATVVFLLFAIYGPMIVSINILTMEPFIWITAEFMRLKESLGEILNTIRVTENGEIVKKINGFTTVVQEKRELENDFTEVNIKINRWIADHQKLFMFHRKTVDVIQWTLTVQLLCTTLAICVFSFILSLHVFSLFDTLTGLLVYVPNYLLFYLIAEYGDLVKKEAEGVFDNAFVSSWAVYPKHIQRKLHIIVLRTNYPLNTNVMKIISLSSKTYFQIVQTAYSFYNFLLFMTLKEAVA